MKVFLCLLAVTLTACMTTRYAHWPLRGPMLMVQNPTQTPLVISARDGAGRVLVTATIKPNGKSCFRWPFVHTVGYLIASGSETLTTQAFEPWSADGWEWSGKFEPIANPKVCR